MKRIINSFGTENIQEYYGLIERFERTDDNYQIIIDSVKKSDFDLYIKYKGDYLLSESNTSVFSSNLNREIFQQLFAHFNPYRTELLWIQFSISKEESNIPAVQYENTFQSTQDIFFKSLNKLDARKRADKETLQYLKRAYSLKTIGQDNFSEISKIQNEIKNKKYKFVSVYNVGQGNANAICSEPHNLPIIYFDLGGGVKRNKHTYKKIKKFCVERKPLVFLSHWDFDHYFSAINSQSLQDLKWIVPNQPIGPTAFEFAKKIAQKRNLYIWDKVKSISNGYITVLNGTGKSKNDSGLILIVESGLEKGKENILLPGDCKYKHIPNIEKMKLTGLVASHHGGTYKGKKYIPIVVNGRLAISYGKDNSFKHPSKEMLTEYKKTGWNQIRRTINGNIAFARNSKISNKCICRNSGIKIQQTF